MHCLGAKKIFPTNDWMLRKVIDCLAKTLLVALIAYSNLSFRSLVVKLFILILIPKTITSIFSITFKLFIRVFSILVTQL